MSIGSAHVGKLGPRVLVVRLDRRPVFGQRQLHPDEAVHVAVGDVVHDLPDGPAARAVRRVELCTRSDPATASAQMRAGSAAMSSIAAGATSADGAVGREAADRIAGSVVMLSLSTLNTATDWYNRRAIDASDYNRPIQ